MFIRVYKEIADKETWINVRHIWKVEVQKREYKVFARDEVINLVRGTDDVAIEAIESLFRTGAR